MYAAPLPDDEAARLAALTCLRILDTPPEERFDRITRLVAAHFDVSVVAINLVDAKRHWSKSGVGVASNEVARAISFCAHTILNDDVLLVPDTAADERFYDNPLVTQAPHLGFYAGVPVYSANGHAVGTLCIADQSPRRLTGTELTQLCDFAAWVERELTTTQISSVLIQQQRVEQALQAANQRLQTALRDLAARTHVLTLLHELSDLLHACESVDEATAVVGLSARALFPSTSGALYMRQDDALKLVAVANWGNAMFPLSICRHADQTMYHNDVQADDVPRSQAFHANTATLCVPLLLHEQVIGELRLVPHAVQTMLAHPGGLHALATTVADQIALALSNIQLRDALRQQALYDVLTGLHNRRYLHNALPGELARAIRTGKPVSILMVDIDHFKQINDTWGHATGDRVLCAVGQLLRNAVRSTDTVCRSGGEEFVVLLVDAPLEIARQRAEALRAAVQHLHVGYPSVLPPVTISIGVAVFPDHASTADSLLSFVDAVLYEAKRGGRNAVVAGRYVPHLRSA